MLPVGQNAREQQRELRVGAAEIEVELLDAEHASV
jgi:hypothetical protein